MSKKNLEEDTTDYPILISRSLYEYALSKCYATNTTADTNANANTPSTADFVQDLYLKELKAYKPTPIKESDSVGHVQTFSAPKTPKSPEEADLASSLKEYESMAVEVEGNEGVTASSTPAVVEDWLVDEEEEEAGAHH